MSVGPTPAEPAAPDGRGRAAESRGRIKEAAQEDNRLAGKRGRLKQLARRVEERLRSARWWNR